MEDFDFTTRRGTLVVVTVDAQGSIGPAEPVLCRPYHLSYPHVFAYQGEVFMVPETHEAGVVELYRARNFPDDWVKERTLVELPGLDSTVFRAQDRWWMFTSPIIRDEHPATTLLFSAPELDGEWRHHPSSPIATDVRYARSGGSVIQEADRLIRVHQDCSGGYGRCLGFSEVTQLSLDRYQERFLFAIAPGWLPGHTRVHTYNRAGDWEVVDGKFLLSADDL